MSVTSPTYSASATSVVSSTPSAVEQIPDDLGGAGGVLDDVVERAEQRVVVVVVDVDQRRRRVQRRQRVAVEVAAVKEDHRAPVEVSGRRGDEAVE